MVEDYLIFFYWTYIQSVAHTKQGEKQGYIKQREAWAGIENCQRTLKILAQGRHSYVHDIYYIYLTFCLIFLIVKYINVNAKRRLKTVSVHLRFWLEADFHMGT